MDPSRGMILRMCGGQPRYNPSAMCDRRLLAYERLEAVPEGRNFSGRSRDRCLKTLVPGKLAVESIQVGEAHRLPRGRRLRGHLRELGKSSTALHRRPFPAH
jgi:hypothetical protein